MKAIGFITRDMREIKSFHVANGEWKEHLFFHSDTIEECWR